MAFNGRFFFFSNELVIIFEYVSTFHLYFNFFYNYFEHFLKNLIGFLSKILMVIQISVKIVCNER